MKIKYNLKDFQNMSECPHDILELGYDLIMAIQEAGYAYDPLQGHIRYQRKDKFVDDARLEVGSKEVSAKALFEFIKGL